MDKTAYKLKVKQYRAKLKNIGVKEAMYYFTIKYPEYKWKNKGDTKYNRIDNLWHGKIQDDAFLAKMDAFVWFKKIEFD